MALSESQDVSMKAATAKTKDHLVRIESLDETLLETKRGILQSQLVYSKNEETQLHHKFKVDNERSVYLRHVHEEQRLHQELIIQTQNELATNLRAMNLAVELAEEDHLSNIRALKLKIENASVVGKGVMEQVAAEEKHQRDVMQRHHAETNIPNPNLNPNLNPNPNPNPNPNWRHHAETDSSQDLVDEKQSHHADAIRSSKEKAALQREKMVSLRFLPQMLHDIENYEARITQC